MHAFDAADLEAAAAATGGSTTRRRSSVVALRWLKGTKLFEGGLVIQTIKSKDWTGVFRTILSTAPRQRGAFFVLLLLPLSILWLSLLQSRQLSLLMLPLTHPVCCIVLVMVLICIVLVLVLLGVAFMLPPDAEVVHDVFFLVFTDCVSSRTK